MKIHRIDMSKGAVAGAPFGEFEVDVALGAIVIGVMGQGEFGPQGQALGEIISAPDNLIQIALGDETTRQFMTVKTGFYYASNEQPLKTEKLVVRYQLQEGFIEIHEVDPCKIAAGYLA